MSLFHLPFRKESGSRNMATDWWLLQQVNFWEGPIFRRYGWDSPHISFGYGQSADWVISHSGKDYPTMVRRPTGGGIVRHGTDLTYCIILPRASKGGQMTPRSLYGIIHEGLGQALRILGIETSLKPCSNPKSGIPGDCFREPVGLDLMDESGLNKIAGAAMKLTRHGVLVQGALELKDWPEADHEKIENAFTPILAQELGESICPTDWSENFETECSENVRIFSSTAWNFDRKWG